MTRIVNIDRLCVGARTFHAARARQKFVYCGSKHCKVAPGAFGASISWNISLQMFYSIDSTTSKSF